MHHNCRSRNRGRWVRGCVYSSMQKRSLYCSSCLLKWKSDAGRHVLHAVFPVLPINGFEMKIQTICMSQNLHLKNCDKLKVSLHSLIIGFQGQWADLSDNGQEWATKDRLNQQTFNHQLQCMQGHMLFIQNDKLFWQTTIETACSAFYGKKKFYSKSTNSVWPKSLHLGFYKVKKRKKERKQQKNTWGE